MGYPSAPRAPVHPNRYTISLIDMNGVPDPVPRRTGVLRQVEDLGHWFDGRIVPKADPSDELITAGSLLDPDMLRAVIIRCASTTLHRRPPGIDEMPTEVGTAGSSDLNLRFAVSRLSRNYCASLTTLAIVGLTHGFGIDLSADKCTVIIKHNLPWAVTLDSLDDDVLGCSDKPAPWPISGRHVDSVAELREYVWRKLYAENQWPVLDLAIGIGKIGPGVVWTNAAERVALIAPSAKEYLDCEAADPSITETDALLNAATLPGVPADTNPLADRFYCVPGDGNGFPETVQTRRACCLSYLLADRFGRLCGTCPYLPLTDRVALTRERHGVPVGTPGGDAERRSIEHGLARRPARQLLNRKENWSDRGTRNRPNSAQGKERTAIAPVTTPAGAAARCGC